ncbi:hypothetical protein M513_13979 [Trichuris suis]|uniref:Uncharacterized protein n=1 Tax=Trichuris suis TaxID=68888 RepID=A0A085LJJ8_9BILA|nr:hypothetical protein M513_13979 [Trichuris suis]
MSNKKNIGTQFDSNAKKEQRSYDKIKELEKKSHYWTNFSELKKGKTAERVLTYWAKIRNEFKVMEKEQLQLEKIEPSAADENMRKELYDRIRETENECKRWALEIVVEEIRTKAYDPCANNTIEYGIQGVDKMSEKQLVRSLLRKRATEVVSSAQRNYKKSQVLDQIRTTNKRSVIENCLSLLDRNQT